MPRQKVKIPLSERGWYTVEEAAERLGMLPRALYRHADNGKIPVMILPFSGVRVFDKEVVEQARKDIIHPPKATKALWQNPPQPPPGVMITTVLER